MVTSHGSKPARWKAAAISRSPLEPSSRRIATADLAAALEDRRRASPAGSKDRAKAGARRCLSPACSSATCAGSPAAGRARTTSPPRGRAGRAGRPRARARRRARIRTAGSARVRPIATHGTSLSANTASAASRSSESTSSDQAQLLGEQDRDRVGRRRLGVEVDVDPAVAGERHLEQGRDQPAVAERSWPALTRRSASSSWTASNARASRPGSSTSGDSSPTWPKTCASAEPPSRWRPPPRSTSSSTLAAGQRSGPGSRVAVMSGTPT